MQKLQTNAFTAAAADDPFDFAKRILFSTSLNVTFERHTFRKLVQLDSETVAQFATRLKEQNELGGFGDPDAEWIRNRLAERVHSDQMRKKFLNINKLSLQKALEMAHQFETKETMGKGLFATPATPGLKKNSDSVRHVGRQEQQD